MTIQPAGDSLLGRLVSHYRIVEHLGAGGMGSVYVAEDEALGRRVALKVIRHDRRSSHRMRERFQREARLLSRLDHPGVCRIYDYLEGEFEDFLVLELIQGSTLAAHARVGIERSEALRLCSEIAEALIVAHGQAIVHRDLKPANVMVTDEGVVKVLDFGLAHPTAAPGQIAVSDTAPTSTESAWSSVEGTLTEAGTITGTLRYMSPEQARTEPLTTASDIYSLGLIAQELLTGERAYPPGLIPGALWVRVRDGRALPFVSRDKELRGLIEAMKSTVVSRRPTAVEVARALAHVRARPRRRLVQALAAAAALIVAGAVTKYVLDLDHERGLALRARDDADLQRKVAVAARDEASGRRDQAEELLGFMVGDLRRKLEPLGRLDVLDDVGDQAQAYFAKVPEELLSDQERLQRSRLLCQIGEIRRLRGDLPAARVLYQDALEVAQHLTLQHPENLEWLLTLGAGQFYVGLAFHEQGAWDEAQKWWLDYLDTCRTGLDLSGGTETWRKEVAMAHTNLGALAKRRYDLAQALEHFELATGTWRDLKRARPADPELALELADALSYLAETRMELAGGSAPEAHDAARATFEEELGLRRGLLELDPGNTLQRSQIATAEAFLGKLERQCRQPELALQRFESAASTSRALCEHDPSNADWQAELSRQLKWSGDILAELERPDEARSRVLEARVVLTGLVARDPTNARWRNELEQLEKQVAELEQGPGSEE